jgi:hypothetical protein
MAVIILGGLVSATLFNLFIAPSLYLWLGPPARPAVAEPAFATATADPATGALLNGDTASSEVASPEPFDD